VAADTVRVEVAMLPLESTALLGETEAVNPSKGKQKPLRVTFPENP
jgi:hypothetical protein